MNRRIIILSMFVWMALNIHAQVLSNADRRKMNIAMINLIEEYEITSPVPNKNSSYRFTNLFLSPETRIVCDIFNNPNFLSQIPVSEYSNFMLDKTINTDISISNIKKGDFELREGNWHSEVTFEKRMVFDDENEILFPIGKENQHNLILRMDIIFDEDLNVCHIFRLDCLNANEFQKITDSYIVLQNRSVSGKKKLKYEKWDNEVLIGKEHIVYNEYKQAFVHKGQIRIPNDDIKLEVNHHEKNDMYEIITLDYHPKHFRFKIKGQGAPLSAYTVSSKTVFSKIQSFGYEFGLDLGVSFALSNGLKLAFYTGASASYTSISFETGPSRFSIEVLDADQTPYTRNYTVYNASQGATFLDMMFPGYAELNIKLAKPLYLSVDGGIKYYLNTIPIIKPFHIVADVNGTFSDGTPVTGSSYNMGHIDKDYNEFISAVAFTREKYDMSLYASAGFDIKLKGTTYMEIKCGYEKGLAPSYQSNEYVFSDANNYSLIYSTVLGRDILVRPIADCVSFTRNAIWFNLGLKKKF